MPSTKTMASRMLDLPVPLRPWCVVTVAVRACERRERKAQGGAAQNVRACAATALSPHPALFSAPALTVMALKYRSKSGTTTRWAYDLKPSMVISLMYMVVVAAGGGGAGAEAAECGLTPAGKQSVCVCAQTAQATAACVSLHRHRAPVRGPLRELGGKDARGPGCGREGGRAEWGPAHTLTHTHTHTHTQKRE
jgi:hypothetical protein